MTDGAREETAAYRISNPSRITILELWSSRYVAEVNSRPMASACTYAFEAMVPWFLGAVFILIVGRYPWMTAKYLGWVEEEADRDA